ncbi:hypothetical protein TNCV_2566281 [Trichonephila clavipes]|nr:hypothetical protein TNCV_2566281 [Trichonephila clavipes]
MIGGILIEVHMEIDPRGTMLIKGSRTGTVMTEMIVGSRIAVVGISSEIRVRVTILTEEAGLTLNKDKCNFGSEKLRYLGLVISKDEITIDESEVKAIIEMKPPKNAKEV